MDTHTNANIFMNISAIPKQNFATLYTAFTYIIHRSGISEQKSYIWLKSYWLRWGFFNSGVIYY